MTPDIRYALYLVPPRDSLLWEVACRWLGRDPETGACVAQPEVAGFSQERIRRLTHSPRQYGFHATLKAPFRLAAGASERQLMHEVAAMVGSSVAITMPDLSVQMMDGFIALRPVKTGPTLRALSDRCVTGFDAFRAPMSEAERARRRAASLTLRQREFLEKWGYPYVLDEYRFHMTLTERVDEQDAGELVSCLQSAFGAALEAGWQGADLGVFVQPDPGAEFVLRRRFRLPC